MHHVAIMNKSWKLIPKILSKEKSIESRWYKTRRTPWNKIQKGDMVYFKNSGEPIIAKAYVSNVLQLELKSITDIKRVIKEYGEKICLVERNPDKWGKLPKYCILIGLQNPKQIKTPFQINKKGFGNGTAWITIKNINTLKVL